MISTADLNRSSETLLANLEFGNGAAEMLRARTHVTCENRRGARIGCSKMRLPQGRELGLIATASEPLWALPRMSSVSLLCFLAWVFQTYHRRNDPLLIKPNSIC